MMLRLLALLSALLLASCIDGREEYWFHRDGSGRMEIDYTVPASAIELNGGREKMLTQLRASLTDSASVKYEAIELTPTADGRVRVFVAQRYTSLEQSQQALTPKDDKEGHKLPQAVKGFTGNTSTRWSGLSIDITRIVSPGEAVPALTYLSASRLRGHSLSYIVHSDDAWTSSNATETRDDGKTLEWKFPLDQAVKQPLVMQARMPIRSAPWWIAGGALALAGTLVFVRLRRKRKA